MLLLIDCKYRLIQKSVSSSHNSSPNKSINTTSLEEEKLDLLDNEDCLQTQTEEPTKPAVSYDNRCTLITNRSSQGNLACLTYIVYNTPIMPSELLVTLLT